MRKLLSFALLASLLVPTTSDAATTKPTPKPAASKAKVVKKPVAKKPVAKKKKKLPPKKPPKWPPPGFTKQGNLYAKTATKNELYIAANENEYIGRKLIDNCEKVACLGIFVGSETSCDWWEVTSNVLGIDPANPTERMIYGSLTTLVSRSKAKTIKPILLVSDEPIADGLGISNYTANCRSGPQIGKIPSNTYTKSPTRS